MNLQQYLKGRPQGKKDIILRDVGKLTFPIGDIVRLPNTTAQFEMMHAYYPGDYERGSRLYKATMFGRLKAIGNRWCEENCREGWAKMRNPMDWVFENPAEALLFKFAFT